MSEGRRDMGVVGLGVMGANLARNLAGRGHGVVGYDRDPDSARRLVAAHPEAGIEAVASYEALVAALEDLDQTQAKHYNVECSKCRRQIKVPAKDIKRFRPPEG